MTPRDPEDAVGGRVKQPQGHDASHGRGRGRPAGYVAVAWLSEQLRDQIQRNGTSLAAALQATDRQTRAPQPSLGAEP
jgi:hypothetical protein